MTAQLDVVQAVLAAEHAAVYGYGVLAGTLAGEDRQDALDALDEHRARRDRLRAMAVASGARPVEAAATYQLPQRPDEPRDARGIAGRIEGDVAVAYGVLVEGSTGGDRSFAARAVQDAAARQAGWTGQADRYPGLPRATAGPSASPTP